jgi:hypothetical protein
VLLNNFETIATIVTKKRNEVEFINMAGIPVPYVKYTMNGDGIII